MPQQNEESGSLPGRRNVYRVVGRQVEPTNHTSEHAEESPGWSASSIKAGCFPASKCRTTAAQDLDGSFMPQAGHGLE